MTFSVRAVAPDETSRLAEIGALTALAYLSDGLVDQSHPYIPQLRDAQTRAEDAILLMLSDGERGEGAAVGTVTLVPPGSRFTELARDGEFELRMLAVSPLERGRGIGRELTRAALDMAVASGATRVVLSTMETMHAAHRLYEAMGFARRQDLDWLADPESSGPLTPEHADLMEDDVPGLHTGVRLLGYSWEP
ncbi:GNAT family N-acetyltransferase [Demequina capsici]|uniref:GNAT family N-acetyltransferase n=1 Tax=Demequina capsici TaxID=3075620 RepID=A0AA96F6L0_9MICO|nr:MULTISPECIES: GNAT family N-acetyltransferase [unclassified Demequina]WNM23680.1 GNAT family N-acetyltransferase [Demequina sp. OYTSA14]WNM26519.1 GNAT family N-acetyltransferase [Demequina sp. PMTSA13]